MQELIKVSINHKGTQIVSARDLYAFLGIDTPFTIWIQRMFEYGFIEGKDFITILLESTGGRPSTDYALTLDCAKEISMIQRSEKGKQARQYFLECERKAKNPIANLSRVDMAKMILEAEEEKERLQQQIQIDAPKVLFANSVTASEDSILIGNLATILKQNGYDIGQNRLFAWLRENHFLGTRGEYYNQPTQKALDLGLFEVVKRTIQKPESEPTVKPTTKVTGKGQLYFVNKFLNQKQTA